MSERDVQRIRVLSEVLSGRRTEGSAAAVLEITPRQVRRLLVRLRDGGGGAIGHRLRGRPSNRRIEPGIACYAIDLVRERYADFGPSLAAEKLAERHDLKVSTETLRKWMIEAGLWLSRKQRRTFHQPRLRRESLGELIQIDGSEHRWFEDRAGPCTLLVFIDDATGRLMQLRFVDSESTETYFEALRGYLEMHGCPVAFYADKHTVFRVAKQDAQRGHGITQFGRALSELNIEILCANSSQAKGRVERVNRTLQDRLVKELRLVGINSIAAGNAFLPDFVERFNARFAVIPARATDLHRRLNVSASRLRDILCHREMRHVGAQLTVSYDRKRIMLIQDGVTQGPRQRIRGNLPFRRWSSGRATEGLVPALCGHRAARTPARGGVEQTPRCGTGPGQGTAGHAAAVASGEERKRGGWLREKGAQNRAANLGSRPRPHERPLRWSRRWTPASRPPPPAARFAALGLGEGAAGAV